MSIIVKPFLQQVFESKGLVWDREAYAAGYAEGQANIAAAAHFFNGCRVDRSIGGADIRERLEASQPEAVQAPVPVRYTPRGAIYYGPEGVRQSARDRAEAKLFGRTLANHYQADGERESRWPQRM